MVLGDIGAAILDQPLDHRLHLLDMLGRARLDCRVERAERLHVGVELRLGLRRDHGGSPRSAAARDSPAPRAR